MYIYLQRKSNPFCYRYCITLKKIIEIVIIQQEAMPKNKFFLLRAEMEIRNSNICYTHVYL